MVQWQLGGVGLRAGRVQAQSKTPACQRLTETVQLLSLQWLLAAATWSRAVLHRLRAQSSLQSCSHFRCRQLPGRLHFWQDGNQFGGFHYPCTFDDSLERLTELREVLYLPLQFIKAEGYTWGPAKGRESQGEICEPRSGQAWSLLIFCLWSPGWHYLLSIGDSTREDANQGSSPKLSTHGSYWGFIT